MARHGEARLGGAGTGAETQAWLGAVRRGLDRLGIAGAAWHDRVRCGLARKRRLIYSIAFH